MARSLRAWGRKIALFMPSNGVFSFESPVFFTPKLGELCPHLCRERSSKQQLAACHWLLGRKERESAFILFSDFVTSVCHLLPASIDLSLTFHKTSLSCLKDTVILTWAFNRSSRKPNTLKLHILFWKTRSHFWNTLQIISGELMWMYVPQTQVLERKCQGVKLCSVSKYDNFLLKQT